jgi:peptidyl-prolyl cis-trans isomerase B (cyclophilin B)
MSKAIAMLTALLLTLALSVSAGAATTSSEGNKMYVQLTTSMGNIILELDAEKAPKTVENFVQYVKDGHYDGTIFHRVIAGFMIQGGGMDATMNEKDTRPPIENEAKNGLKNDRYTIAMARTGEPHSATSQFFINTPEKDNDFLNFTAENARGWGYAVFGKVLEGQAVVDKIEDVETSSQSYHDDVPNTPVIIEKAEVLEQYTPAK